VSSTPQRSQHISIPDLRSDLNGEVTSGPRLRTSPGSGSAAPCAET
jgi:hypothetical protein